MFTLPPDPYKALGLSKDAQLSDVRSAYKKLVLKCHPDKFQNPQLKAEKQAEFQQVQEAYELLNDEIARSKYDEKVRYNEKYGDLEKEKEKAKMSSTPPNGVRTPSRPRTSYFDADIRTAEPRPSTFAKAGTSPSQHKFYKSGFSSSHSWDDDVGASAARAYDDMRRSSKKSASYERDRERDRDRDREREREREREWEREKERERRKRKEKEAEELTRERERERLKQEAKAAAKEAAKEAEEAKKKKERRDKDKKKADKERKRETEEKHRRHKPYAEPYHEDSEADEATVPVFEKKSSSSRKHEEAMHESIHVPTSERERKNSANLESAIRYLERSGAKPTLSRSPTFQDSAPYNVRHVAPPIAAPTPPPATTAVHPPPPPPPARDSRDIDVEEDAARRSSGRSSRTKPPDALRTSTRESRDKSSHRKSSTRSASRDAARPGPAIVEVAPSATRIPPLRKTYSDPHKIIRSYTTDSYPRPVPLERTNTWQQGDEYDRSRGRRVPSFEEESEDDARYHRHTRRTQSPEPMTTTTQRYSVAADGKTHRKYAAEAIPIPTPRGRKVKHVMANTSSPRADPGANGYYQDEYGADLPSHAFSSNVKYAPTVREEEVQYSTLARGYSSTYTKDPYSSAQVYAGV